MIPLDFVTADQSNEDELFTLYGNIYDEEGNPALETSMKLIPRGSIWANDGTYLIEDITEGEHTVRAYFMNNGHTVAYRQIYIDSDTQLDWHVGKNWVTGKVYQDSGQLIENSTLTNVKLVDNNESEIPENGRISFGPYEIGNYYTVRAYYGDIDHSTQYVHFKMQSGSATEYDVNDFHFHHGKNLSLIHI